MNRGLSKGLKIAASILLMVVAVAAVLWERCGINGCPKVEQLNGYMPDRASVVLDHNGQEVGKLYLTRRVMVRLDSLPKHVPDAFIAMEDKRFWKHHGVDWTRVFGAAYRNIRELGITEGSSTITMQLARNAFPEHLPANKRTMWRKIGEARVARSIEKEYTKEQILELYLNQIYFGHGAYGIEAAAEEYFGKPAQKLLLSEAATLAALPRAPSKLNPRSNRELALKGRDVVLARMEHQGLITAEEAEQAGKARLRLRRGVLKTNESAPYFVDAIRRQLEEQLGEAIYSDGYTVETTLDLPTQRIAEEEVRRQLANIENGAYGTFRHTSYAYAIRDTAETPEGTDYLQAALVFMDPLTGDVRALIGGRDYLDSQYNRATLAARQLGSAFKPFVYSAAVAAGYPPTHRLLDQPIRLALDRRRYWEPKNYDGRYLGGVTMRQALAGSRNVPTVRLALEVGIDQVVTMAQQIGLGGHIPNVPSVVLGTAETTPLDVTSAFATFATLGSHPVPRLVTRVLDSQGQVIWSQEPSSMSALDPAVAFIVTSMLKDVVDRGTGTAVRAVGFRGVAAGKTGTTNDAADIWFVGYTPRVVGTIWLGFDKRSTVVRGATGGELAAPIWGRIMARLNESNVDWAVPSGVETRMVDDLGNVYAENCPLLGPTHKEYFLSGTAPLSTCYADPGYLYMDTSGYPVDTLLLNDEWWQRLRRKFLRDRDTMYIDTFTPVPPVRDTIRRDTIRRDTLLGDTLRRDTIKLPRDTTRPWITDTTRKPPRDTVRRDTLPTMPWDTTGRDTLQGAEWRLPRI